MRSDNLTNWTPEQPFLIPSGAGDRSIPECPDLFHWNGWHYLLFGMGLTTRYRMARHPLGPWLRPANDLLDSPLHSVMQTAPFVGDRRLGAGWVGTRVGDRDTGNLQWGGCAVFRELAQHPDGTLSTRFVPEMIPTTAAALPCVCMPLTAGAKTDGDRVTLNAAGTEAVAEIGVLPQDFLLHCRVTPERDHALFGLGLRRANATAQNTFCNSIRVCSVSRWRTKLFHAVREIT